MASAYRYGNDIRVYWTIIDSEGHDYNLEGRDLRLWMKNGTRKFEVTDYHVAGNIITWVYYGKNQSNCFLGTFEAILCENCGEIGMATLDVQEVFRLVSRSKDSSAGDGVRIHTEAVVNIQSQLTASVQQLCITKEEYEDIFGVGSATHGGSAMETPDVLASLKDYIDKENIEDIYVLDTYPAVGTVYSEDVFDAMVTSKAVVIAGDDAILGRAIHLEGGSYISFLKITSDDKSGVVVVATLSHGEDDYTVTALTETVVVDRVYLEQNFLSITDASATYLSKIEAVATYLKITDAAAQYVAKTGGVFTGAVSFSGGMSATSGSFSGEVDMSNHRVKNVANPVNDADAANKGWVAALIGAINQFHYEVYPSIAAVTNPSGSVLYLIGPSGSGDDKYEEYVYDSTKTNPWIKIGDTSVDLSGYQRKPTHFGLDIYDYLCIRLDQRASFLRLDVTYDGVGIGQFVVITTNNPSQAKVIATKGIKDKVIFQQFTYPISGGHPYLGIYHYFETYDDHSLSIDVATLSGEAPDMITIFSDSIGESTTDPVTFTAVSYLADNTDLALKQDTLVSGENIKTINEESILGSGNVPIIKDYGENDPDSTQYIRNRKGGYDIVFDESIICEDSGATVDDEECYFLPEDDFLYAGGNGVGLLEILRNTNIVVPCSYIPTDGDSAGLTCYGTILYDREANDIKLVHSEETGTSLTQWVVDYEDIPGIEGSRFPVQFPSKYIPHDSTKQDTLVSGTNIKTINGTSILGSGNMNIKGVYWVDTDNTTYQDIRNAINAGLFPVIFMESYGDWSPLVFDGGTEGEPFVFARLDENGENLLVDRFVYDYDRRVYAWDFTTIPLTSSVRFDASQSLTDAQKLQARTNIGATAPEVFWATYGTTTYNEVVAANTAGKIVMCQKDENIYQLQSISASSIFFSCRFAQMDFRQLTLSSGDVWGNSWRTLESTANKKTDIASNRTSETYYPNTKGVFDLTSKWGVISQTQTWSGSASTGYTYVMSDLVYGAIPQANIDLFTAAGAEFDTATGYFKLNGLTDISYEEMKIIYNHQNALRWPQRSCYGLTKLRTVFNFPDSSYNNIATNFEFAFANSAVEVLFTNTSSLVAGSVNIQNTTQIFYNCSKLRSAGYLRAVSAGASGFNSQYIFYNCYSLQDIYIRELKSSIRFDYSPILSEASLLYLINNETSTAPITVTLHPTVYAKTQSGGEWYSDISTALAAHTNISLASA